MYKNTRFGELLKGLPRGTFEKIVSQHQADKYSKGFSSWDQLTSMIYGQIAGANSLREIELGFNSHEVKHYHLGTRDVRRSTLSDANNRRDCSVFEDVCKHLMSGVHKKLRSELTELLYLIDSTGIMLKKQGYENWRQDSKSHRIQGLKMHTVICETTGTPVQVDFSHPSVNDVSMGKEVAIEKGMIYAFDKGYYDYNWWYSIHLQGATLVTRRKNNAQIAVVEDRSVIESESDNVLKDSIIEFTQKSRDKRRENHYIGTPLRQVVVARDGKDPMALVTNDLNRPASEIADIYKKRWEIELIFKWLKQNLKIKRYLGRSENAIKTQIYIALITYLLVKLYHYAQGLSGSLRSTLLVLKATLFNRPEVEEIMDKRMRVKLKWVNERQIGLAL